MALLSETSPAELERAFRRPELARAILGRLKRRLSSCRGDRPLRLMEVCGTHTMAISRSGLRTLLAPEVELVSGPGCPVCVTAQGEIDAMLELAGRAGVIVATFGDMMRVPGSRGSLIEARAAGARVEVVYSIGEAVRLAAENRGEKVVFLGVGFETTAPGTALALEAAAANGVDNFLVYSAHKLVPPALAALLHEPDLGIEGFVLPGHVSVVLGRQAYDFLAARGVAAAIAGFEPVDILLAVDSVAAMLEEGRVGVENAYTRAVAEAGNPLAREAIARCFAPVTAVWRGLGPIPGSGLAIRDHLVAHDAARRFGLDPVCRVPEPKGCSCGAVLRGKAKPTQCALFAKACTPVFPVGPCMVSTEGACAAYYRFERQGGEQSPPESGGPSRA